MRYRDIHLMGLGTDLGDLVSSEVAVADGRFDAEDAARTGQRSVSCSAFEATRLAVAAGRRALGAAQAMAGIDVAARLSVHLHASVCSPGLEVWSASCHILDQLAGPGPLLSVQLNATSNGCLAAIELAAQVLTAAPDEAGYALVTTGDSFTEPDFPRWNTDRKLFFGDGAGAAVLGPGPGVAALLSTASYTDPSLEGLHRGDEQVIGGGRPHATPIDLKARSQAYLERIGGAGAVTARNAQVVQDVVGRVLKDAGAKIGDVGRTVLPFFGREFLEREYLRPLGIDQRDTLLDLGLTLGHLGAADQIVGLDHLLGSGQLRTGDLVLLLGVGAGFTWTAAVVRIE